MFIMLLVVVGVTGVAVAVAVKVIVVIFVVVVVKKANPSYPCVTKDQNRVCGSPNECMYISKHWVAT